MTTPMLSLPNGSQRSLSEVLTAVDTYARDYPAVFEYTDAIGVADGREAM